MDSLSLSLSLHGMWRWLWVAAPGWGSAGRLPAWERGSSSELHPSVRTHSTQISPSQRAFEQPTKQRTPGGVSQRLITVTYYTCVWRSVRVYSHSLSCKCNGCELNSNVLVLNHKTKSSLIYNCKSVFLLKIVNYWW